MVNKTDKDFLILAIESAIGNGSISVLRGSEVLESYEFRDEETVSISLLPKLLEIITNNQIVLDEINLIAVSTGPGSLTGIRIGISIAKGIANSLKIGCLGVPILDSFECFSEKNKKYFCLVSSGMNKFIWKIIDANCEQENRNYSGNLNQFYDHQKQFPKMDIICNKSAFVNLQGIDSNVLCIENLATSIGLKGFGMFQNGINDENIHPQYIVQTKFVKTKM